MAHRSLHPLLHYLRRLSGGLAGDSDQDDTQLLPRLANCDEAAFTIIVRRYGAMVWELCVRRLGETPEAEDAFQATFLVLVRKASRLRGPQLGPWLYGVASRTALKVRGRRAWRAAHEITLSEQPVASVSEQPEQVWRDLRPVIDEEVNRLPEKYRLPVVLCYLEGLSSEEAARRLGCAQGTIFSRLSRARDLLRGRLARRGLSVSAGVLATVLADNAVAKALPPASLTQSTIHLGVSFAAGTANQAMSAPLAALVEGVLRSMFLSKVKLIVVVLSVLGIAGSGAGFLAHHTVVGQAAPAGQPIAVPAAPAAIAAKAKEEAPAPKPKPKPDEPAATAKLDAISRLKEWRERLIQPLPFDGADDPKLTLREMLDQLSKRRGVFLGINEKAFEEEEVRDVSHVEIIGPRPLPAMGNISLATVLRIVLDRVPARSGVVYVLRPDSVVEITTMKALRTELGMPDTRPVLPLVWDVFEETPLTKALARVTEMTGFNVMVDPRGTEKMKGEVTAQFNNVPVDTAVRLLANMADLSVVRLDNVFYVTTPENAKRLREEQTQINTELPTGKKPAAKPVK